MTDHPQFLTAKEIAEILKVSPETVRNWIESGELAAFRFGGTIRIEVAEFEAFKERSKVATAPGTAAS